MSIVLNEHEWAHEMIVNKSLGKKPFETLSRVARYYIDNNYSKKETRSLLDAFIVQCDPSASLPKWSGTLDRAVTKASKMHAINIEAIEITKPELEVIERISGVQTRRLAFTLLCLAKYWDAIVPNGNHWTNTKDNEIMKMANVNTSIKRQSMMYASLRDAGLVEFSKKIDNTNVRVLFMKDGDVAIRVTDFRNLGFQYLLETGSNDYMRCTNCGIVVKKKTLPVAGVSSGRAQKYCRECAADIKIKQTVNSVMTMRGKKVPKPADVL